MQRVLNLKTPNYAYKLFKKNRFAPKISLNCFEFLSACCSLIYHMDIKAQINNFRQKLNANNF